MAAKFSEVYKDYIWEENRKANNLELFGNGSGPGSGVYASQEVRSCLTDVIRRRKISSILDAPCGSFNWQPLFLRDISQSRNISIRYHGVDIVSHVIAANKANHNKVPNITFDVADITLATFSSFDLIIARDVFLHLSYDKIFCALNAFSRSNSSYLLTTTFPDLDNYKARPGRVDHIRGRPLNAGGYRSVNMQAAPLLLPQPVEFCRENKFTRSLGLWKLPLPIFKYDANDNVLKC